MKTRDAIKHFGEGRINRRGRVRLAEALEIRPESTYSWGTYVPALRQLQLERVTGGVLRAQEKHKPKGAAKQ